MGSIFFILSVALFVAGIYLFVHSRHIVRILLGAELLIHAAALNFVTLGNQLPPEVAFFVLTLVGVAVAEGSLLLILFFRIVHQFHHTHVPLFDDAES